MTVSLYGDTDMTRVMYGQNARHVPAWLYVQHQGPGVVGIVGASRVPDGAPHPLRYGNDRQHSFIVGEIIIRPHLVITTDALKGYAAGGLYLGDHDFREMLSDGEVAIGSDSALRRIRQQWER